MIESILLSFLISKSKIHIELGKLKFQKESYKLTPIFKHWSIYPMIIMSIFYIYLEYSTWNNDYSLLQYSNIFRMAFLSSFLVLAIHYNQTMKLLQGIIFMSIGTVLNNIAIKVNSNHMPIFPSITFSTGVTNPDKFLDSSMYGDFHVIGDYTTKLIPLCDFMDNGISTYSIGDIFIFSFAFILIYGSVKASNI